MRQLFTSLLEIYHHHSSQMNLYSRKAEKTRCSNRITKLFIHVIYESLSKDSHKHWLIKLKNVAYVLYNMYHLYLIILKGMFHNKKKNKKMHTLG